MNDSSHDVNFTLTNLEQYTRYAIHVQAYTVALQTTGKKIEAQSNIIYGTTYLAGN